MIGLLQRIGHRETLLGFLGWCFFAVVAIQVSASLLAAGYVARGEVPVVASVATIALGVGMGRRASRRGALLAVAVLTVSALPFAIAGAVVTAFTTDLGWPLLAAPILLAVGSGIGIVSQRQSVAYENPGSAAVGAGSAFAVFAMSTSLALGSMNALLGQGVVVIYSQLAAFDCLDPPRARLAEGIRSLASQQHRDRVERSLQTMHAQQCKD